MSFGYLQAIAAYGGIFQFGIDVMGIVVLAVPAKPEQFGDDHLRTPPIPGAGDCFTGGFEARCQIGTIDLETFDAVTGGLIH